jgi:hypothetical protein
LLGRPNRAPWPVTDEAGVAVAMVTDNFECEQEGHCVWRLGYLTEFANLPVVAGAKNRDLAMYRTAVIHKKFSN